MAAASLVVVWPLMPRPYRLPPRQLDYHPSDESLVIQTQFAKAMTQMQPQDGIGLAFSYLLLMASTSPSLVRNCLNEQIVREGFRGESMLTMLTRLAR